MLALCFASVIPALGAKPDGLFADAVAGGGTDEERCAASPLLPDRMSPLAELSLLVKEEMAHPAQDVSFAGVPMRGAPPDMAGDGSAVSGMD
jgi:hypothetical protein